MLYSNLFFYNNHFERDNNKFELIDLMQKSCMVHQDSAGIFSSLTLGLLLEKKITRIIEDKMQDIGFSQVRLSLLQDGKLWEKTKRIDSYGEELFKLRNRKNQLFCLSATAEESITSIYQSFYNRQKANCHVFQIGNKYRDEMRARAGLVRGKEFIMKDAYSFCSDKEELFKTYEIVKATYLEIFNYLGLNVIVKATDSAQMGGDFSEEFLIESELADSEDGLLELGHIFQLGDTYSKHFDLLDDKNQYVQMACYGIGVSRVLMALLEKHRDNFGFAGTETFNTFDFVISAIDIERNEQVKSLSFEIYQALKKQGKSVLLDDRKCSAGKKMSDAELICAKSRIIVSKQAIEKNQFELLNRQSMEKIFFNSINELLNHI
jgi:prolyl-tRNA synthetase